MWRGLATADELARPCTHKSSLIDVRYSPIATEFRRAAKRRDVPQAEVKRHAITSTTLNDIVQSVRMKSWITAMARSGASPSLPGPTPISDDAAEFELLGRHSGNEDWLRSRPCDLTRWPGIAGS
jgi:hypothetical protein